MEELVSKFGYSAGFVVCDSGRQQLFTGNTLTPILPLLLRNRDLTTAANMARLWTIVPLPSLGGAVTIGCVLEGTRFTWLPAGWCLGKTPWWGMSFQLSSGI